jgi:hypothetical protein
MWRMTTNIANQLNTRMRSEIAGLYTLDAFQQAVQSYTSNMSAGKVILKPQGIENEPSTN